MFTIELQIEVLKTHIERCKEEFEAFINNQSISLQDRWSVFVNAPDYLKNTQYSMCSEWGEYFGEDYVMYDGEYNVERYNFVNAAEVIETAEENREFWEDMEKPWNFFNIEAAKEKILAANLLGAKYDW